MGLPREKDHFATGEFEKIDTLIKQQKKISSEPVAHKEIQAHHAEVNELLQKEEERKFLRSRANTKMDAGGSLLENRGSIILIDVLLNVFSLFSDE
ncbi:MAG: hypothetical protein WBB45_05240 [Cyclobacteriaceae bacterium]